MSEPTTEPIPAIRLDRLTRDYGTHRAVNDVSLDVAPGEILGYVGPNGAGKTTTLKILAGLLRPTWGRALVVGHDVVEDPLAVKRRVGYVPESGAVFTRLTPREHLVMVGRLRGIEEADLEGRVPLWLARLGLEDQADRRLGELSKGNRQRAVWAGVLMHEPPVLILDEPLAGLDLGGVSLVKGLLLEAAAAGRTVMYSSHLVDVVERLCTRIAVLTGGRLVASGSVDELREQAGEAELADALAVLCAGSGGSDP